MSNYNSIYQSMMANHIENFQQLDPNMMTVPSSSLAMPPMDNYEPAMTMDMMNSMVKENFYESEPSDDNEVVSHQGDDTLEHESDECPDGNCEPFEGTEGDETVSHSDDGPTETLEHETDSCPDGEICERFEDEIQSETDVENFENDENKDMELWTCYPNKENFENVNDSLFYKADGNVAEGSSNKSSIHPEDKEMSKLYMYLAIAVVALMVVYLLTNNK